MTMTSEILDMLKEVQSLLAHEEFDAADELIDEIISIIKYP